jgi:hypothetical protein
VLTVIAACHHHTRERIEPQEAPPLAAFASQHVVVPPTPFVHAADSLGWVAQLGGARATARLLDSAIVAALDLRDVARRWILPAELVRSYERNRTYATDPYEITADALRGPGFKVGSRYGDPLASQLRTMIALHENTRFVLLPIALRFEAAGLGERAVLRAALLDARATEARWVADVRGDSAATPMAALTSVADKLADNFAHP